MFKKSFNSGQNQYVKKILKEKKNVVIFGFGFSGSGKTYQLVSPKNNSILKQFITEIFNNQDVDVTKCKLDVTEFYPYQEEPFEADNIDSKNFIKDDLPAKGIPIKKGADGKAMIGNKTFDKEFERINKEIENYRYNTMRICPTPNNPESSRGHLIYEFSFGGFGKLVIIDMAGTENTVEIKKEIFKCKEIPELNKGKTIDAFKPDPIELHTYKNNTLTKAFYEIYYKTDDLKPDKYKIIGTDELIQTKEDIIHYIILNFERDVILKNCKEKNYNINETVEPENFYKLIRLFLKLDSGEKDFINIIFSDCFAVSQSGEYNRGILEKLEGKDIKNDQILNFIINLQNNNRETPLNNYINEAEIKLYLVSEEPTGGRVSNNILEKVAKKDIKSPLLALYSSFYSKDKIKNYNLKLSFIIRYIQIVVNQGRGIVTTLEHIKHFFLCNGTPDQDGKKKIHHYNLKAGDAAFYNEEGIAPLLDTSVPHTVVSADKAVETIEKGFIADIGFCKKLNEFANISEADNKFEVVKTAVPGKPKKEGLSYLKGPDLDGSIFIMLACIRRETRNDQTPFAKSCAANFNTMELCQALTSKNKQPWKENWTDILKDKHTAEDEDGKITGLPTAVFGGGKRRTKRRIPKGLIASKKRRGRSRKLKNAKSNLNFSTKKK